MNHQLLLSCIASLIVMLLVLLILNRRNHKKFHRERTDLLAHYDRAIESAQGQLEQYKEAHISERESLTRERIQLAKEVEKLLKDKQHLAERLYAISQYRTLLYHDAKGDLGRAEDYLRSQDSKLSQEHASAITRSLAIVTATGDDGPLGQNIQTSIASKGEKLNLIDIISSCLIRYSADRGERRPKKGSDSAISHWQSVLGNSPFAPKEVVFGEMCIFDHYAVTFQSSEMILRGHRDWLEIMIMNILKNAFTHMNENDPEMKTWFTERVFIECGRSKGGDVVVSFTNRCSHPGVRIRRILEPGTFTLGSERRAKVNAEGVGVSLIQHVVEGHSGNVAADPVEYSEDAKKFELEIAWQGKKRRRRIVGSVEVQASNKTSTNRAFLEIKGERKDRFTINQTAETAPVEVKVNGEPIDFVQSDKHEWLFADPFNRVSPSWAVVMRRNGYSTPWSIKLDSRVPRWARITATFPDIGGGRTDADLSD